MTLMIFASHPDDEVLGAGGTIAKYSRAGEKVIVVVFSYGEGQDPIQDPALISTERINETKRACKLLGASETIFLGISDLKFVKEASEPSTFKKIQDILEKYRPNTILAHVSDDMHPAHRAVAFLAKTLSEKLSPHPQVFGFTISAPFKWSKRVNPRLYVDVTNEYRQKLKALECFKSSGKYLSAYYVPLMRLQNWLAGFRMGCRYAEEFYGE